jgi:hypothetical protein
MAAERSSSTRHSGLLYGDLNSRRSARPSGPGGDPGGRRTERRWSNGGGNPFERFRLAASRGGLHNTIRKYRRWTAKAMTLIAGVKCIDGFLVAADTAVTTGETIYHGEKLHYYLGKDRRCKLVIACAGHLAYARMRSQEIRDAVVDLSEPTLFDIKGVIKSVIADIYARLIQPYWQSQRPEEAPRFSLICACESAEEFELVVSEDTAIEEVGTYCFQGSGSELAQHLAETFLRSRGNLALPFSTAAAVHLIAEISSKRSFRARQSDWTPRSLRGEQRPMPHNSSHRLYPVGFSRISKQFSQT